VRLVIRLSSDYLLRLAEPLSLHVGDLVTGLIMMDVIHANTEHLPTPRRRADDDWSPEGFVRDSCAGRSRAALRERLGIPQETVRRHLRALVEDDRCERVGDGYVVPAGFWPATVHPVHGGQSVAPAPLVSRTGGFRRSLRVGTGDSGLRGAPDRNENMSHPKMGRQGFSKGARVST
jgi:hypothetical protein